jgi:hypothetical protein
MFSDLIVTVSPPLFCDAKSPYLSARRFAVKVVGVSGDGSRRHGANGE